MGRTLDLMHKLKADGTQSNLTGNLAVKEYNINRVTAMLHMPFLCLSKREI